MTKLTLAILTAVALAVVLAAGPNVEMARYCPYFAEHHAFADQNGDGICDFSGLPVLDCELWGERFHGNQCPNNGVKGNGTDCPNGGPLQTRDRDRDQQRILDGTHTPIRMRSGRR